jgi:hypothetical protein
MEQNSHQTTQTPPTKSFPFDEFKLIYESAEKVTDRRLELNRSNASLSILVIAGMGITAGWAHDKPDTIWFAFGLTGAMSVLGYFFCLWWRQQLVSYKDLNTAKFDVLNEMAKNVVFPGYGDRAVTSAEPFDREWQKLLKRKQLQPRRKDVFALSASFSELTVPASFQVFFAITTISSLLVIIVRYGEFALQTLKRFF